MFFSFLIFKVDLFLEREKGRVSREGAERERERERERENPKQALHRQHRAQCGA